MEQKLIKDLLRFRYNLPAKNVLPEYVCDYKKRAGLFQRSADLE